MPVQKKKIEFAKVKKELSRFEKKYKIPSWEFYDKYERGEILENEIGDRDAIDWVIMYEMYIRFMSEKIRKVAI